MVLFIRLLEVLTMCDYWDFDLSTDDPIYTIDTILICAKIKIVNQ